MPQLEVKNLTLGYEGREIVKDLNFTVNKGDYLCIVGENGSGKSTLMKTLLSLTPKISGEIIKAPDFKNNTIGYLPQQTVVQKDFPASVFEIVLSGFSGTNGISPFYSKEQKKKAEEQIKRMGIENLKNRCYRELSGGQQQRVLLSRALCATDQMILLDEPVAGLDVKVTAEMYELIDQINKDGITVIMISHDLDCALKYATHILHIGKTVFFGTKEEYLNSRQSEVFIDKGEGNS